jgi:chromosomal replication initiation ATPase DnaA
MSESNGSPAAIAKGAPDDGLVETLKRAVRHVTGITFGQMAGRSRKLDFVYARMIFAHGLRKHGYSYPRIGRMLGRNHATVCHAIRQYENELALNPRFRKTAERVESIICKFDDGNE